MFMKKLFAIILFFLFSMPVGFCQYGYLLDYKKHQVKKVLVNKSEVYSYEYHAGMILEKEPETQKDFHVHHYYYFNSDNQLDSIVSLTKEGEHSITSTKTFKYDNNSKLVSIRSKNNNIVTIEKYFYNDRGHIDSVLTYQNSYKEMMGDNVTLDLKPISGKKYLYNVDGLPLIEERMLPQEPSLKIFYTYNSKNQLVKKIMDERGTNNSSLRTWVYKYNKKGMKKKVIDTFYNINDEGDSEKDTQVKMKYKYKM